LFVVFSISETVQNSAILGTVDTYLRRYISARGYSRYK